MPMISASDTGCPCSAEDDQSGDEYPGDRQDDRGASTCRRMATPGGSDGYLSSRRAPRGEIAPAACSTRARIRFAARRGAPATGTRS